MISFGPTEEQELIRDTVREFGARWLTAFYAGGIELLSLVVSERVMDGDNTRLGHVISLRVAMTV